MELVRTAAILGEGRGAPGLARHSGPSAHRVLARRGAPGLARHSGPSAHRVLARPPRTVGLTVRSEWGEPGWNWGSARGEAHDRAIPLRRRLASPEQRRAFLAAADEPWPEIKLCLGLTLQRAAREGISPAYQGVYEDLVAGRYEGEGGEARLSGALAAALGGVPAGEQTEREVVAAALQEGLGFIERGC